MKKSTRKVEKQSKKARKIYAAKVARKNSRKRLTLTTPVVIAIPSAVPHRPNYLVQGAIRTDGRSLKTTTRKADAMKPIARVAQVFVRLLGLDGDGAKLIPA